MKISARTTWLGIIIGLLSSSVIANMIVLFVYAGAPSEALEENWEVRAAEWDKTQAQRIQNRKLGWKVEAVRWEFEPKDSASAQTTPVRSQVWMSLHNAGNEPLAGAQMQWQAFVRARPDQIFSGQAVASEDPGQYRLDLPFPADRTLEFQVTVEWQEERFTHTWIEDPTLVSRN